MVPAACRHGGGGYRADADILPVMAAVPNLVRELCEQLVVHEWDFASDKASWR